MNDDRLRELDGRRRHVLRIIEQAEANVGLHSDAAVSLARKELSTIDRELADLFGAKAAQAQAVTAQMTGRRFDRELTEAGQKAIQEAQAELDKARQDAADAITAASQEIREKAARLDQVNTEHGQFPRFPSFQSVALELARLAEEKFHVR